MSRDIKYVGMDVHKEAVVIAVLNGSGKLVMESIVETKASSILQFIHGLRGELHVTWEEGTWAAWLYDLLQPQVTRVLVCDPRRNALLKEGIQERQGRCVQASRLVTHGNAAAGLSRGTRTADAARAGTQLSDFEPRPEPGDESDQSSVSRLEHPLACAASQRMVSGPLHETTQARPATAIRIPVVLCGAPGVKTKILSTKKKGPGCKHRFEVSRRAVEKCFCLTSSLIG
jgi:hypothetical protein